MDIHDKALEAIRDSFDKRFAELRAALATCDASAFVFCWERYGLGVRIDAEGRPHTVGVEQATIIEHTDQRKFRNGSREPAVIVPRKIALKMALQTLAHSVDYLEAAVRKQEQV